MKVSQWGKWVMRCWLAAEPCFSKNNILASIGHYYYESFIQKYTGVTSLRTIKVNFGFNFTEIRWLQLIQSYQSKQNRPFSTNEVIKAIEPIQVGCLNTLLSSLVVGTNSFSFCIFESHQIVRIHVLIVTKSSKICPDYDQVPWKFVYNLANPENGWSLHKLSGFHYKVSRKAQKFYLQSLNLGLQSLSFLHCTKTEQVLIILIYN